MSIWEKNAFGHPSCQGDYRTDVLETSAADPTYLAVNPARQPLPQTCAWARSPCSFQFHGAAGVREITADVAMGDCSGTWAAPLWISPSNWTGYGASGEIDVLELCGGQVAQNFAGGTAWGGTQAVWAGLAQSGFPKRRFHVRYSPEDNGTITTWSCPLDADGREGSGSDCEGGGNYKNFARTFGETGDARYALTSDVWNGVGAQDCERARPSSTCNFEISNVRLHLADGADPDAVFPATAPGVCRSLLADAPPPKPRCPGFSAQAGKIVALGHGDLPGASSAEAGAAACCARCSGNAQCDAAVYWDAAPGGANNCFLKGSTEPTVGKYLLLADGAGFTTFCAPDKCL